MKRMVAVAAGTILTGVTSVIGVSGPAGAQVPAAQADYRGYSTGAALHVGVLRAGASQIADVDLAYSGATVASQGTGGVTFGPGAVTGSVVTEYGQVVQPALPNTGLDPELRGDRSFGRGSALEVGVATTLPNDANTIILSGKARASAPPSSGLVTKQIGPVKLDGIAYASLLRGEAQARFRDDRNCIVGQPLSFGSGYAADAQLLGSGGAAGAPFPTPALAADATNPDRRVSQSQSITRIIPQVSASGTKLGDNFGLMTETRMTIAPVTLFPGTPTALTIEFAGEWVFRAVATGVGGAAGNYVFYGPGSVSPSTPVLRVIPAVGSIVELTLQQLLGQTGLTIPIPGVAEIALGEDPRAIGGDSTTSPQLASDGTMAAGAVDVVRVTLLGGSLLDLRLGHMEARAQVPPGGIQCTLPVTKTSDKQNVNPGEQFTYTVTVENPFADCTLRNVRIVDTISTPAAVKYSVAGTNPPASVNGNVLTFENIGDIAPLGKKSVTATIQVANNSGGGVFTNTARATGVCATGTAQGTVTIDVTASGEVTVQTPQVGSPRELPVTGIDIVNNIIDNLGPAPAAAVAPPARELPRTGGSQRTGALLAGLLLVASVAVRRVVTAAR